MTAHARTWMDPETNTIPGQPGAGSPEGVVLGSPGDQYSDNVAGTAYVKGSGVKTKTGWVLAGGAVVSGPGVVTAPVATGARSLVGGSEATDNGLTECVVLGKQAQAHETSAIVVGPGASVGAGASEAIAIGSNAACATYPGSIAIGSGATCAGQENIAIGNGASTTDDGGGDQQIAIGSNAFTSAKYGIAIGFGANAGGPSGVSIGQSAGNTFWGTAAQGVCIGNNTGGFANTCVAIGESANNINPGGDLDATQTTAVGSYTITRHPYCCAIGTASDAAVLKSTAIGGARTGIIGESAIASSNNYDGGGTVATSHRATDIVLQGETPGSGAGETVELLTAGHVFQVVSQEAYIMNIQAIASDMADTGVIRAFFMQLAVYRTGAGVTSFYQIGSTTSAGHASAASWTLVPTVGVGPDRIKLTFSTGATTTAARCIANAKCAANATNQIV